MITRTTLSAIRTLIHLGRCPAGEVVTPRAIAEVLGESPTYLAKVTRLLVKAGILRAEKGSKGGVYLSRPPMEISMLAIFEACQGAIGGDHCERGCAPKACCSYHHAAEELRAAVVAALSRWNLERLMQKPQSANGPCVMAGGVRSLLMEIQ